MSAPADAFTPAEDAQLDSATRAWQRRNHLTDTATPTSAAQFADVLAGTALVQALGWERCLRALTHKTSRRTRSKEAKSSSSSSGGSSSSSSGGSSSSSSSSAQQGGASAGAAASQVTPAGAAAAAAAAASLLELHSGGLKRARETVAVGGFGGGGGGGFGGGGGGGGGGGDAEDDAATVLEGQEEGEGAEEEEELEGEEEEVTEGDDVRAAPPALRAPRYSEGELRKLRRALVLPANRPIPGTPQRVAGVALSPARASAIAFWERIAASISDTPEPRTAVAVYAKACQLRQQQ